MVQNENIEVAVNEFLAGGLGEGAILFHKKMHKQGSGEFACVRGILQDCPNVVNCPNCYHTPSGSYCTEDAQSVVGLLAIEEKHRKLVREGAFGAYSSVKEAMNDLA